MCIAFLLLHRTNAAISPLVANGKSPYFPRPSHLSLTSNVSHAEPKAQIKSGLLWWYRLMKPIYWLGQRSLKHSQRSPSFSEQCASLIPSGSFSFSCQPQARCASQTYPRSWADPIGFSLSCSRLNRHSRRPDLINWRCTSTNRPEIQAGTTKLTFRKSHRSNGWHIWDVPCMLTLSIIGDPRLTKLPPGVQDGL